MVELVVMQRKEDETEENAWRKEVYDGGCLAWLLGKNLRHSFGDT